MKNMKLIMENFRKNMQEARFGDPDFVPGRNPNFDYEKNKPKPAKISKPEAPKSLEDVAFDKAVADIMRQYDERELHNMMYDELEDLFVNRFADNHPEEALPTSEEVAAMFLAIGLTNPEEEDDSLPSDVEEPPGFMPGEGGNY